MCYHSRVEGFSLETYKQKTPSEESLSYGVGSVAAQLGMSLPGSSCPIEDELGSCLVADNLLDSSCLIRDGLLGNLEADVYIMILEWGLPP